MEGKEVDDTMLMKKDESQASDSCGDLNRHSVFPGPFFGRGVSPLPRRSPPNSRCFITRACLCDMAPTYICYPLFDAPKAYSMSRCALALIKYSREVARPCPSLSPAWSSIGIHYLKHIFYFHARSSSRFPDDSFSN